MANVQLNKYKISRRGRKLQVSDDSRTLVALPKEIPERTWAELLQKEENDLLVLDIREELLEEAMRIGYERYMERQTAPFAAHCAARAWLKLIDWYFYRHDPGEEPSAAPACYIPRREDSWRADERPEPSPQDSWGRRDLPVCEEPPEEILTKWPSSSSLDVIVVDDIPEEYWFPGRVNLPDYRRTDEKIEQVLSYVSSDMSSELAADSELLQKVTDYSAQDLSPKDSMLSALKTTTPVEGSLRGAGDCAMPPAAPPRRLHDKSKSFSRHNVSGRSRGSLAPLDIGESRSRISIISDCRLRNLRLDTQYEVSSEKVDTPPGEGVKRK